ncbi:hypothetical protein Pmani_036230 [Petrolisthes manimaculis]|uniref:Uncharacterized protein n=1 Tax=Petrolisthes manimaculis TaxID=1843537 RepID=A0AAE1NK22_9EUCA|nr:hypothetical protein Pmani_036230 [Petrolisthes manimaculis]
MTPGVVQLAPDSASGHPSRRLYSPLRPVCGKLKVVTVKTKDLWRSRRRWAQAAAMEIFDCVDCFQSRPRVRVRQPRPPSESPPPPYSRFNVDLLRPEDAAPSEEEEEEVSCLVESQETGGTNQYDTYSTHGTVMKGMSVSE